MYKTKQMKKTDLYCTKCLKVADDSINVELKYGIDRINRPYSKCTDFRFSEFITIDDKDLNYH